MKILHLIYILIVLLGNSCYINEKKLKRRALNEKPKTTYLTTSIFTFDCPKILKKHKRSYLKSKIKRLQHIENKYIERGLGQIKLSDSKIVRGIVENPEISFQDSIRYKINNVESFKNSIYKIKLGYAQRTKNLNGTPYPKIIIEEIIFKSESCAKKALSYIKHARSIAYFWNNIDKSPSVMFREENRIYFISSGGRYLKKFPKKIAETIKN